MNLLRSITISTEILEKLKVKGFQDLSIFTYDFLCSILRNSTIRFTYWFNCNECLNAKKLYIRPMMMMINHYSLKKNDMKHNFWTDQIVTYLSFRYFPIRCGT